MKEKDSESEDEGFRRRSAQSRRQSSRQKEKSSDIEGELVCENYRLAEEYLNKYVGASETKKNELLKGNDRGHAKNRTEQSTEYRMINFQDMDTVQMAS